jgi:hypothetical protein
MIPTKIDAETKTADRPSALDMRASLVEAKGADAAGQLPAIALNRDYRKISCRMRPTRRRMPDLQNGPSSPDQGREAGRSSTWGSPTSACRLRFLG